jgi:2-oxoglutarate ferredoxin oxidoreductase subunit beta
MKDYACANQCTWCDGCGDYGVWTALKRALVELGIHPWQALLCYDVGCHGNMSDKLHGYRFHGLHGRVIPFASGAKLANPEVPVLAFAGDGATFSEGIGHLVHAIRSNYPITFILHNNCDYALTTGQASALTWQNQPMNSAPNGIPERTLNPMEFVFSLEPTFVARGFSGDIPQLTQILKAAIEHQRYGLAYVEVLQVCTTYNHFMTQEFLLERCYKVEEQGHDPTNFEAARKIAGNGTAEKIATGILYQRKDTSNFYERLVPRQKRETTPVQEVQRVDVSEYLKELV